METIGPKIMKENEMTSFSKTTSQLEDSFKSINFPENFDSLIQPETARSHSLREEKGQITPIPSKSIVRPVAPHKIPSSNFHKIKRKDPKPIENSIPEEKTVIEAGYNPNDTKNWESIDQPKKRDLYGLLKNMIDNHIKPNVQIRIGEASFFCHMMVLQCYSDFFMNCSNEVLINIPPEVVSPDAFVMVYDWMLSAEPSVQREGILELFNAANFLRIKELVNQCWVCLDDDIQFKEDSAFLLYLEARSYGLNDLQQLMLTRICQFFLTLVAWKDFLLFSSDEVCNLLSSNTIGVNSELEIFMSAVRWLNYNWEERKCYLIDVMKCVRFGLMQPWVLVDLEYDIGCEDVRKIIHDPTIKKMIKDGLSYTTKLHNSAHSNSFLAFMERNQLTKPIQRRWICDPECGFHHKVNCPHRFYITYESFLEYLEMIRSQDRDHWKKLCILNEENSQFQCCPSGSDISEK